MANDCLTPLMQTRLEEIKKQLGNIPDTVITNNDAAAIIAAINAGKLGEIRVKINSIMATGLEFTTAIRVETIKACWNDCLNAILTDVKVTLMNLMIENQNDPKFLLRINQILKDIESNHIEEAWSKTGWTMRNADVKPRGVYSNTKINDAEKAHNKAQLNTVFETLDTLIVTPDYKQRFCPPTEVQAKWITDFGLDPEVWYVQRWTAMQADLQNKLTSEPKTIHIYE